ncbi:TPA: bifunctional phosphoribosylaminoimidazolecarboxamide formyltransferase/inosine monophosphate cyclohydrolase [bacterium]|nr:bifunctional phosphoribosylaminoimidazolecarboxamide formyltransferase/inosine monophosphate cyclohydrolase [bacterium]
MIKIRRALISVSDKRDLISLAEGLSSMAIEIISTGGTAASLKEAGIKTKEVSEVTGFPEMLGGRVKTLHPGIHAGILARRDPGDFEQLKSQNIEPIDLVVVNLYPFKETIERTSCFDEIIENIDIGGPTMIRSAAKNFKYVVVVVDPSQYGTLLSELQDKGGVSEEYSFELARQAFNHTARYDAIIAGYLNQRSDLFFPEHLVLTYEKIQDLRYGENPHQQASFYRGVALDEGGIASAKRLQGKELSFNNILDLEAGFQLVREFEEPAVVIIKHNNPCGVGLGKNLKEAFLLAYECDPVSAFGGVIGLNRVVDEAVAIEIAKGFVEAIIAPGFDESALQIFSEKKNLRLLELPDYTRGIRRGMDTRSVSGGLLLQSQDVQDLSPDELKVASRREPEGEMLSSLLFAFRVAKFVKSNAIVLAKQGATVGIGAGQMSRVDALRVAVMKAGERTKGSVLASDAFFPFRDVVDEAARAGVEAIIQPGGSIRDEESITAVNEHGLVMVFTGVRHFRH